MAYVCVCIDVMYILVFLRLLISSFFSDILTFLDEVEHGYDTTTESSKTPFQAGKDTTQNELNFTAVSRFVNLFMLIKF
jgi:hypothetical protein